MRREEYMGKRVMVIDVLGKRRKDRSRGEMDSISYDLIENKLSSEKMKDQADRSNY